MEDTQLNHGPTSGAQLSFNEVYLDGEINSVMNIQNMKWDNNLSGNRINMHLPFSTSPVGTLLLQANSTDNAGLFGNTCMLVCAKAIEIFQFRDELDVVGYLFDNNESFVMFHVKYATTDPHSIIQRFLGDKVQVMTVRQLREKSKIVFLILNLVFQDMKLTFSTP